LRDSTWRRAVDCWTTGAELYVKAADNLPHDEELFPAYLIEALKAYWHAEATLAVTVPVMEKVRVGAPHMKAIWGEGSKWALEGGIALVNETIYFFKPDWLCGTPR